MTKGKILEFEIFRAFAIIAVVLIHASSRGVTSLDPASKIHMIFNFLNKISLFAVPSFIFMSGVVLFYTYYARWQAKDIIPFYVKRIKFIVVPYVVVSLLYYLFNQRLYYGGINFQLKQFLNMLPWAEANYHLYFIIIILQFYLLFPVLLFVAKKYPQVSRYFTVIGVILFLVFYSLNFYYSFPHRTSLCFTYFIYFFLGASIGMNYKAALAALIRKRLLIGLLALITGIGLALLYIMTDFGRIGSLYLFDLCFYAYGAFASLFLLWLAYFIHQKFNKLSSFMQKLGAHSFGIYLIHPALLGLYIMKIRVPGGPLVFFLNFIVSFIVAFGGAYLLTVLIKRFIKPYWILIGK